MPEAGLMAHSPERRSQPLTARKPRNLQDAVSFNLDKRRDSQWPVSIAETVQAVRDAMPGCDLTDDELSDLVTIAAMERGLSISFDSDLLEADEREDVLA